MKILCISASLFCLVCCAGCLSDSRENGVSLSGGNCKTSEYISRQVRQVREVSFLELLCGLSGLCVRRTDRFCNWLSDEEPCTVNSSEEQIPLISFSDACLTPLAYSNRLIRCKGVLKKIKYGPLIMRPVSGELHDDEHLVHAGDYLDIGVEMRDGEPDPDSDVYGGFRRPPRSACASGAALWRGGRLGRRKGVRACGVSRRTGSRREWARRRRESPGSSSRRIRLVARPCARCGLRAIRGRRGRVRRGGM